VISKLAGLLIQGRMYVMAVLMLATAFMCYQTTFIEVKTVFDDMLPANHPYVQVHKEFKATFSGSNLVSIMVEVDEGKTIFQMPVLEKIKFITDELRKVTAVDQFQITSLASKKLKDVKASTTGIESRPLMWPDLPTDEKAISALRDKVLANSLVFGRYVSVDQRAALITVDFIDRLVDYGKIFDEINAIAEQARGDGIKVKMVGDPILYGWVNHYIPETMSIVGYVCALVAFLLLLINQTWRGTLLPMLSGFISTVWALGIAKMLGFHFDPLVIVVAMLIAARAISHSVQMISRFEDDIQRDREEHEEHSIKESAQTTLTELFRPGILGIATDAFCVLVVALSPIPLLQKLAILAVIWVATVALSALIITPVLLSWVKKPHATAHPLDVSGAIVWILDNFCYRAAVSKARYYILGATAVIFSASLFYAFNLSIGDAQPGSPILWPDAQYNRDSRDINGTFQGADRMFIVLRGEEEDVLKTPAILTRMEEFQRFMEAQPQVGGSFSLAEVLPVVNVTLREGNPRYSEFGDSSDINGELVYMFESSADPGDMSKYADTSYQNGAVTFLFKDRKGDTIRTAIFRVREFIETHPLEGASYELAGGVIGLIGAVNEVILSGQIQSIALALLILVILCAIVYRSLKAGMFFMVPVILSNTLTFSFMAYMDIAMNINTVPVAALGIGLGVDYSLYVTDRVKEEFAKHADLDKAIYTSLHSAGRGVFITASVLIVSVLVWYASSLKFQAEMGLLMGIWLAISAVAALIIVPSMIRVFKPKFILED